MGKGGTEQKMVAGFVTITVGLIMGKVTDPRIDRVILSDRFRRWAGIWVAALQWFLANLLSK